MFSNSEEEQRYIEKAIEFMVKNYHSSEYNSKPAILHSIKVGLKLLNYNYELNIIIAGILHDILEDTEVSYNELTNEFNQEITEIVMANTFDSTIEERFEQGKELIQRCVKYGKKAMIVKTSDRLDNIEFQKSIYNLDKRCKFIKKLIAEHKEFAIKTKPFIEHEEIWIEYTKKLESYFGTDTIEINFGGDA